MKKNRFTSILVAIVLFFFLISPIFASSIITDDFFDTSKIAYSSNINFNTTLGYAELQNKTVSEMETPYNSSGLVAQYHLNDFTHTSNDNRTNVAKGNITDSSGNNNHGDFFHVNQDQLKAWYGFEDGNASTTITDLSGNGNTGTWNGKVSGDKNVTESYDGLRHGGYFDGLNDFLLVQDDSTLNFVSNFSFLVWVKTFGNSEEDSRVISKRLGQIGYELYINSVLGYLEIFVGDSSGYTMMTSFDFKCVDGVYHHLVFKREGNQMFLYIDGEFNKQQETTVIGDLTNVNPLLLGKYSGNIRWFNGTMDDVRLYNRALSQNEIQYHYQQWFEGRLNQGLRFDGLNSYVEIAHDSSLTLLIPFTLETWIKREPLIDATGMIITKDWNYKMYRTSTNKISILFKDQTASQWRTVTSNSALTTDFTHVCARFDANGTNTKISIFFNGALDKSDIVQGEPSEHAVSVVIGANQWETEKFIGMLDEIRLYNRSLPNAEIKENYESYYSSGFFYSINLLKDQNATEIQAFSYDVLIDGDEEIELQFSQDNNTWFNSDGIENGFESCSNGSHIINLKGLAWSGNFYYRSNFTRGSTPKLYQIKIIYYYPMWSEIFTEFLYGSGAWLGLTVILTLMIIATAINRWASLLFLPVTLFMGIAYLINVPVDSNFLWGALIMFMGSLYCLILPIQKLKH